MPNLPALSFTYVTLIAVAAAAQDGAVHKWVDKDGQIHITTTPPPKGASAVPDRKVEERWVYEWQAPDGSFHVTTTTPPADAKVKERVEDPRVSPGAPTSSSTARLPDGTLPASALRATSVVGQRAPNLEYLDGLGNDVALADLRGQIVWLVFASRHSKASAAQARVMAELGDAYGDDVTLLLVLGASADVKAASAFAREHSLDAEAVLAATPDAFPLGAVPHSVFLDRSGRIVKVHPGRLGVAEVRAAIEALR